MGAMRLQAKMAWARIAAGSAASIANLASSGNNSGTPAFPQAFTIAIFSAGDAAAAYIAISSCKHNVGIYCHLTHYILISIVRHFLVTKEKKLIIEMKM